MERTEARLAALEKEKASLAAVVLEQKSQLLPRESDAESGLVCAADSAFSGEGSAGEDVRPGASVSRVAQLESELAARDRQVRLSPVLRSPFPPPPLPPPPSRFLLKPHLQLAPVRWLSSTGS